MKKKSGSSDKMDWTSIRIEKDTAKKLDNLHIERMESYNSIIKRLIQFYQENA